MPDTPARTAVFRRIWRDERGASKLDYAMLVSLIALTITLSVSTLAGDVVPTHGRPASIAQVADAGE
jgi:Flp pilus assembly pilin Flp